MGLEVMKKHLKLMISIESWLTTSSEIHACDLKQFHSTLKLIFSETLGSDFEESSDIWQCAMFDVAKECYPDKVGNLTSEVFNELSDDNLTPYQKQLKVHIERYSRTAADIASYLNYVNK